MIVRELTCVSHVHSVHSDGSGTIPEIAAAGRAAGADAVLVTDHDTTRGRSEAGWHDGVLVIVGVEVSPGHGSHLLAFGVQRPIPHVGRTLRQIVDAVHDEGGVCFAAHPFSRGGWILGRAGRAAPWGDLRAPVDGIEVWSLVTDTLEHIRSPLRLLRFARDPDAVLDDPPRENLATWDALSAHRRMPAIGGLDAHQFGVRIGDRLTVRTMSYARSFRLLRTHVLLDADAEPTAAAVCTALASGRSFIARDSLADATGFRFDSDDGLQPGGVAPVGPGRDLHVRAPRACELVLLRDGAPVAQARGADLRHHATQPGAYRVEARLPHRGRSRTWVLSNPISLR